MIKQRTLLVIALIPSTPGCHDDLDSGEERHAHLELFVVFVEIRRAARDLLMEGSMYTENDL